MPRIYTHLTTQERAVVMTMRDDQCSIRTIAKRLGRAPSSISRDGICRSTDLIRVGSAYGRSQSGGSGCGGRGGTSGSDCGSKGSGGSRGSSESGSDFGGGSRLK